MISDDNTAASAEMYSVFAEFLFEYLSCLSKLGKDPSGPQQNMKAMAEKAIQLDSNCFPAYYFLAVFHSWNLKTVHSGSLPATYKGEDAASSIVGTAFNLLFKGATLGATAAAAGMSKSVFTTSVQNMVAAYKRNLQPTPLDARRYIAMTSKMFDMADYCEDVNNRVWKDIYLAVRESDVDKLVYSDFEGNEVAEAQEMVMEFILVADSKS